MVCVLFASSRTTTDPAPSSLPNAAPLPPEWGAWTSIRTFSLINGSYTGSLPASYGNWSVLSSLRLERLPLSGPVPAEWVQATSFPSLKDLSLVEMPGVSLAWGQLFTWLDPKGAGLANLTLVNVGNFSGGGLDPITPAKYPALKSLVLSNLNLSGTVPAAWSTYGTAQFRTLDLSGNNLQGPLPSYLMAVVGFTTAPAPGQSWLVDFSRNNFTGASAPARAQDPG